MSLPSGLEYAGRGFELTLRKGQVGEGSAPLSLVLQKSEQVSNFLGRAIEMQAGLPFRQAGKLPPPEVIDMIQARATQARAGSFRFTVRLAAPPQLKLFPELAAPKLEGLTSWVFDFVEAAAGSRPDRTKRLRELAPQKDYRVALLKLVQSITPTGRQVGEVELTPVALERGEAVRRPVVLTPDAKRTLSDAIREDVPTQAAEVIDTVAGTGAGCSRSAAPERASAPRSARSGPFALRAQSCASPH